MALSAAVFSIYLDVISWVFTAWRRAPVLHTRRRTINQRKQIKLWTVIFMRQKERKTLLKHWQIMEAVEKFARGFRVFFSLSGSKVHSKKQFVNVGRNLFKFTFHKKHQCPIATQKLINTNWQQRMDTAFHTRNTERRGRCVDDVRWRKRETIKLLCVAGWSQGCDW